MAPEEFARRWAGRIQTIEPPWQTGGIFPSEMLAFLIACEEEHVDCVIESGRERGYSTQVLAEYAGERAIPFVSLDLPQTPEIGRATRERLAGKPVRLVDASVLEHLGDVVPRGVQRIALLVDGPKDEVARRVLLAAAHAFPVVLVGTHGYHPHTPVGLAFRRSFPELRLTSENDVRAELALDGFTTWERDVVESLYDGPRDPADSTLAIARVPSRVSVRRLVLHDGFDGVVRLFKYFVHRLRGHAVTLQPPIVLALRWKRAQRRAGA
jgi:hypothetical protein